MSKLQEQSRRYWPLWLGVAFAVGAYCVWYFAYPQKLMAWEQSVLFVWDSEYWQEQTAQPSGLWIYLRAFIAQFFYHPMTGAAVLALLSGLLLLATYGLLRLLTPRRLRQKGITAAATFVVALLPPLWLNQQYQHPTGCTAEEMRYDQLLRYGRWQEIVEEGQKSQPQSMACQNAVRLALFQTGQISKQALFSGLGLTNEVLSDRTAAYIMSDVYFHTGLVNMSQRAAFEAMESIDDFNKSGRALVRLTETNLITGNYEVAKKYIALLEKTLYYSKPAHVMRQLAEHPERLDAHPVYGRMKQIYQESQDYMFY